ncbi:hypothetical protein C8Q74DRAFT_1452583 [Fomes fomentarius]|nr:hypothetical protein C8Q74DRAFT_1452583 [Fomes fomentarius]
MLAQNSSTGQRNGHARLQEGTRGPEHLGQGLASPHEDRVQRRTPILRVYKTHQELTSLLTALVLLQPSPRPRALPDLELSPPPTLDPQPSRVKMLRQLPLLFDSSTAEERPSRGYSSAMKSNPIPSLFSPLHHLPNLDLDFDPSPTSSLNPTLFLQDVPRRVPIHGWYWCGLWLQVIVSGISKGSGGVSTVEERSRSWSSLDWVGYGVWALSVTVEERSGRRDFGPGAYLSVVLGTSTRLRAISHPTCGCLSTSARDMAVGYHRRHQQGQRRGLNGTSSSLLSIIEQHTNAYDFRGRGKIREGSWRLVGLGWVWGMGSLRDEVEERFGRQGVKVSRRQDFKER